MAVSKYWMRVRQPLLLSLLFAAALLTARYLIHADPPRPSVVGSGQSAAIIKPRGNQPYIVINTHTNRLYLRTKSRVIMEAVCSTGSGSELTDPETGRHWVFDTPRGVFAVQTKTVQPWWRKPDWAYIEENEPVPTKNADRLDPEVMGDYALGFGDGFFIHGTLYERLLGMSVTHGCIRLGKDDLHRLYQQVPIGTPVYIF